MQGDIPYKSRFVPLAITLLILTSSAEASENVRVRKMIDLADVEMMHARRPITIAHRGGVITPASPECSRAAIVLAAQEKYDMVELDVQETKDHHPVVFHDRNLDKACGVESRAADLTLKEIVAIRYSANNQRIVSLEDALKLCQRLNLGIMLDIKTIGSDLFFERMRTLFKEIPFPNAVVAISSRPPIRKQIESIAMLAVTAQEFQRVQQGESVPLRGKFWFGLPQDLPKELIPKLHNNGALVIPGINTFRYPDDAHIELAQRDIQELTEACVDGFQIDSVYQNFIRR